MTNDQIGEYHLTVVTTLPDYPSVAAGRFSFTLYVTEPCSNTTIYSNNS